MARDALSSGDPVLAENYLQHAEHYNRIIMTFREQQAPQGEMLNGNANGRHKPGEHGDADAGQNQDGEELTRGQEAQPSIDADDDASEQPAAERPQRRSNGPRQAPRRRRPDNDEPRAEASESGEVQPASEEEGERRPARRRAAAPAAIADADEQPDFLKRPVRRARRTAPPPQSDHDVEGEDATATTTDEAAE